MPQRSRFHKGRSVNYVFCKVAGEAGFEHCTIEFGGPTLCH